MSDGYLTTHVLDTARGLPADGIEVTLFRVDEHERIEIATSVTNADGRTDSPLLPKGRFQAGVYELVFHAGPYLVRTGQVSDTPLFLDQIPIRFGISAPDLHYHVPLLLSAHGYSTYRGS